MHYSRWLRLGAPDAPVRFKNTGVCIEENCELPSWVRGWCQKHYSRWQRHGDPSYDPPVPTVEQRFWAKVDKSGECWVWTASCFEDGYGVFNHRNGKRAHRASWELHFGPIPDGMMVCHRCDNPPCVRPDHLFLGSGEENVADRVAKYRTSRGLRHALIASGRKLSIEDVTGIKRDLAGGIPQKEIATRLGVVQQTISKIARGERWAHVSNSEG